MAIWDALSGKVHRWNNTKGEALGRVCKGLKPFATSRLSQYPDGGQQFTNVRNNLLAYYIAASDGTSALLDTEFVRYKERFYSFNTDLFLRFISSLHAAHVTIAYAAPEKRSLLYMMYDGLVEMYCRPPGYVQAWWPHVAAIEAGPSTAGMWKIGSQLYAEIAPILGLPENDDVYGPLFWIGIQHEIAQRAALLYNTPNWERIVEAEFFR